MAYNFVTQKKKKKKYMNIPVVITMYTQIFCSKSFISMHTSKRWKVQSKPYTYVKHVQVQEGETDSWFPFL